MIIIFNKYISIKSIGIRGRVDLLAFPDYMLIMTSSQNELMIIIDELKALK